MPLNDPSGMGRLRIAIAALFFFIAGAAVAQERGEPMLLPVDPAALVVETADGAVEFEVEIADTAQNRSRGLMFRAEMPDDRGMLFVFEEQRRVGFWMRNTPMPLDLLFIDSDGRIGAIEQGEPFSDAPISPAVASQFVLELKAGTARTRGIAEGDVVAHPRIGNPD